MTGRPYPLVKGEEGKIWNTGARQHGTGEMERVEGPDGLDGKWAPSARHNISINPHDAPVPGCGEQVSMQPNGVGAREDTSGLTSDEDAVTFDQGQIGGEDDIGTGEGVSDKVGPRLAEQPAEDRTGLCVEVQCSPRSSSMSRCSSPGLSSLGMGRYTLGSVAASRGGTSSATTSPRSVT
jgi:hypothetical protein